MSGRSKRSNPEYHQSQREKRHWSISRGYYFWRRVRQRECCHGKCCRHYNLHSRNPPAFCPDDVNKRTPKGLDDPRKIQKGRVHRHITFRHSHISEHYNRYSVHYEIRDSFRKVQGRNPSPWIYVLILFHLLFLFNCCIRIIMSENLPVIIPFGRHYSSSYLT